MEDELIGAILKADVHKEDDASPPVALWDSWFYRSWIEDRAMIHPLVENWQHLLGIFWKFSLQWWKHRKLRSWIAFGKDIRSPPISLTRYGSRSDMSVTSIKTEGVDTQQVSQWYGNGRDG